MNIIPIIVSAALILGSLAGYNAVNAASDVRILASTAISDALRDLAPEIEHATGHKVVMEFGPATGVKRKIEAGEKFDITIVTPVMITDFEKQGKIAPGSRTDIARSGYGVAIRAGAARPDISTAAAFRQTLLDAKSIMYNKEGQSGIYMTSLLERLGIAEQVRPRAILKTVAGPVAEDIANGVAELGFQSISEILPIKGAELLGPLPPELQGYTVLTAGIAADAQDPVAAKEIIKFLTTPAATEIMKKRGMEPMVR